ncbi:helix-turn-helix transcriptional regulator [Streptomyces sp. MMG1121]|uniref:helix-turn-helix transcriptional regulator n=1 Tax=Streptomyces sp. MMG1121 TaxID=1415544 RepID=UPI0006B03E42|nr:AraC family transcriptional regulator [Streptomyces sp. MMG1121]KOV56221.1 translation initiation factor IF-2 [Streptomyces sp. MMG1121]
MDKNGHPHSTDRVDIPPAPYRAAVGAPPGAEVFDLSALPRRAHGHGLDPYAAKRPAFHELIALRGGSLRCSLDFGACELTAGDWLWVRPGQIHQYDSDLASAEGIVVLFTPGFLTPATVEAARVDQPVWRAPLTPADADAAALDAVLRLLRSEYRRLADLPLEVQIDVVRHLLSVLVLRLSHAHGQGEAAASGTEAFRRFQRAVERDFARTHRVEDYAHALGYSVRTLTRATRSAVGSGAKAFIDDRVLLEARRLLWHTDLPATAVGDRLGFPDATVFTRFFRRRTGETPAGFRARARGRAGQGGDA